MLKKRYLFLIIIICLFTISTVSAEDNATSDIISEGNNVNSLEANSVNNNINSIAKDNDTLKEVNDELLTAGHNWYVNGSKNSSGDGKSETTAFKTLKEAINNANDNDTIIIASGQYKGTDNTNLEINKNLNFMKLGDKRVIFNAEMKSRIWNITATSINIAGLMFTNGNAGEENGGAIYFKNILTNSNINAEFFNNVAANGAGGAIFFKYDINNTFPTFQGNITGSFINNLAQNGGAIAFNGINGNLNATFIGNSATEVGGAIYFNKHDVTGNLTGIFINNTATNNIGGAIYMQNSANLNVIRDCIFINNGDTISIESDNKITAINCWFGNNATNYNDKPNVGNVTIDNWLFLNATANPTKLNVGETSTINFKLYTYNDTSKKISQYNSSMNLILDLTQTLGELNKNNALIGEDILYTARETGNASVTGKFENAYYTVNIKNDTSGSKKNLIINASANPIAVGENAIINVTGLEDATGNVTVTVNGKTYTALIKNSKASVNVTGLTKSVIANVNYNGDDNYNSASTNVTIIISNENAQKSMTELQNTIKNNKNTTIFLNDNYQWTEQDKDLENGIIIDKSITIDGQGHVINAINKMRIFQVTNNAKVTFKNITFLNGWTAKNGYGGAIWNTGDKNIIIINCTFNDNTAYYGGAISGRIGDITNCTFTNNIAQEHGGAIWISGGVSGHLTGTYANNTAKYGGAIWISGGVSGNLTGTYTNNTAKNYGGAIYISNGGVSGHLTGTYANNTAKNYGGAIYISNGGVSGNLTGTYANNTAKEGGAIYIDSGGVSGNLTGTYINNTANRGGAIYIHYGGVSGNLTGTYINNTAMYGGVIYINGGGVSGNLTGTYINNTAKENGGAIWIRGGVSGHLTGTYINNTAIKYGGAILIGGGVSGHLTGTYINNTAKEGGAILISGDLISGGVSGNLTGTYINNTAIKYGGAIWISGGVSGHLTGTYINNTANENGGAIYIPNGGVSGHLTGTYINNTAKEGGAIHINEKISVIRDCIFINNGNTTICTESGNVTAINCWFGNNATNYNQKPTNVGNVTIDNWLFLNATANPTKLNVGETSTINFKLYAYNNTSKKISPYNTSMNLILDLTQTLGELNKNNASIDENILYTARETGNASVTGKFENAYYTFIIKNNGTSGSKKNLIINATSNLINVGEDAIVVVTGLEDATGNITVTVNDKTYNTSINNGKASVNVTGLTKSVNASVNYTGDDNYNSALINVIIIVNSDDVITDILSIVMGYDIIKYLKIQQKYINTNIIALDVKYLQNLL